MIEHDKTVQISFEGAPSTTQPKMASIDVTMEELQYLIDNNAVQIKPNYIRGIVISSLADYHKSNDSTVKAFYGNHEDDEDD